MHVNYNDFIKFAIKCNAVQFGDFVLKDGSKSNVYFNSAAFDTGVKIKGLARFYARQIIDICPDCNLIFGSAYKGIPLATAVAMELSNIKGAEIGYFFNRKEEKQHGDKGLYVGKIPTKHDTIVFVDDVVTSGKTKEEGIQAVQNNFANTIEQIFVAVDRRKITGAIDGCPVSSLTTLDTLETYYKKMQK